MPIIVSCQICNKEFQSKLSTDKYKRGGQNMKIGEVIDARKHRFAGAEPNYAELDPLLTNRDLTLEVMQEIKDKLLVLKEAAKQSQIKLEEVGEGEFFVCKNCGTKNFGKWLKDPVDGSLFKFCGSCNKVLEVK